MAGLVRCKKGDKKGWKFGKEGVCFVGKNARKRAAATGRAAFARFDRVEGRKAEPEELFEIEQSVIRLSDEQLDRLLGALPPLPGELDDLLLAEDPEEPGKLLPEQGDAFIRTEPEVSKSESVPVRTTIKKTDDELQIVWGEVYVPEIPDAHGHFMSTETVRKMAYQTLGNALRGTGDFLGSDVQHANAAQNTVIVESFVARKNDPTFIEDSWVVGLHIADPDLWQRVKKGDLNGFSIQASVFMSKKEIEVDLPDAVTGETAIASDGDLHQHGFRVRFDSNGKFLGGETTAEAAKSGSGDTHKHEIVRGSVTQPAGDDGHTHRFNLLDMIFGQGAEG